MSRKAICVFGLMALAMSAFAVEGRKGEVRECGDLRMSFGEGPAVTAEENLTAPNAPLTIRTTNGGVSVKGYDGPDFKIKACKAAETQEVLNQVRVSFNAGVLSAEGPEGRWNVFLLVSAPKQANITAETRNGPISFSGIGGSLKVTATNGPVSLKDVSGQIDVSTQNGPLSFSGNSGNVKLLTQNGPLSINLAGTQWGGGTLTASAKNGPVALKVGSGFESGMLVEAGKHSPVSCSLEVCKNAQTSDDGETKRFSFGGEPIIRISTQHGPVSIRSQKRDMI